MNPALSLERKLMHELKTHSLQLSNNWVDVKRIHGMKHGGDEFEMKGKYEFRG